jgi:hypothetical protein
MQQSRPVVSSVNSVACCPGSSGGSSSSSSTRGLHLSAAAASAGDPVAAQPAESAAQHSAAENEWCVLNFYHLVDLADPDEVRRCWQTKAEPPTSYCQMQLLV